MINLTFEDRLLATKILELAHKTQGNIYYTTAMLALFVGEDLAKQIATESFTSYIATVNEHLDNAQQLNDITLDIDPSA